jgi:uncharacterized protein YegP (UPF0339 family)
MKIEIRAASNGDFYYVIVARNGEDLCTSQMYNRKFSATRGAQVLVEHGLKAVIDDATAE